MAFERRSYVGGAPATALQAGISSADTAFDGLSGTGYADGGSGPFSLVIGRGLANEEKILVSSRSSTTFTVAGGGRGYDGTSASAHAVGETIEVCGTAIDFDEANAHVTDPTRDDHTQYLTSARHASPSLHVFGGALPTPAAAQSVGTANAAGASAGPARADHVHKIGTGAINATGMFAATVVPASALVAASITEAQMAPASIGTAELIDLNVTVGKMADNAVIQRVLADASVGTAELIDANVTRAKLATDAQKSVDVAWGFIGVGASTADQNNKNSDGEINVTGMSVTFTAVANRRYKYTAFLPRVQGHTATGAYSFKITTGANTLVATGSFANAVLGDTELWSPVVVAIENNPGAGSTTRKARFFAATAGTSNADLNGSTTPGYFLVEDIGPS